MIFNQFIRDVASFLQLTIRVFYLGYMIILRLLYSSGVISCALLCLRFLNRHDLYLLSVNFRLRSTMRQSLTLFMMSVRICSRANYLSDVVDNVYVVINGLMACILRRRNLKL